MWTWLDDAGQPTVVKKYDEIKGNFFIGNYYGQEAIDNDDGSAYYNTHHNFFAYAGTGMKNDFNGHDNHHHHNLYGFIGRGMAVCGALPGHADKFYANKVVQLASNAYASYDCKCAATKSCPEMHDNQVFTPDGKMQDVCGQTAAARAATGEDVGTSVGVTPGDDVLIMWARELLSLPLSGKQ